MKKLYFILIFSLSFLFLFTFVEAVFPVEPVTVESIKDFEYKGHIIQFKDKPVLAYKLELKGLTEEEKLAKMDEHRNKILNIHSLFKKHIKDLEIERLGIASITRIIPDGNVMGEHTELFNGIALNASKEEVEEIKKFEEVKAVYPNVEVHAFLMNSIPLINAHSVWGSKDDYNRDITGKGITIAIIDTGIDYTHPDLDEGKVIGQYCFCCDIYVEGTACGDNDPGCCPDGTAIDENAMDDNGHGTHCAGISAGNGVLKGVAPDAKLRAYKVLSSKGEGLLSDVIKGIEKAVEDDVDVISLSLGAPLGDPGDVLSQVVDTAVDAGVVVVIAAGNEGPVPMSIGSPAAAKKAITVGASTKDDEIAFFSSRGPVMHKDGNIIKPDVVAPGHLICSARLPGFEPWKRRSIYQKCVDNDHVLLSGTSMACPHVAGAVALLKQAHPDWTPEDIKSALMSTAKVLDLERVGPNTQGSGRIDVLNAKNTPILLSPNSMLIDVTSIKKHSVNVNLVNRNDEQMALELSAKTWSKIPYELIEEQNIELLPAEEKEIEIGLDIKEVIPYGDNHAMFQFKTNNYPDQHIPVSIDRVPALLRMWTTSLPKEPLPIIEYLKVGKLKDYWTGKGDNIPDVLLKRFNMKLYAIETPSNPILSPSKLWERVETFGGDLEIVDSDGDSEDEIFVGLSTKGGLSKLNDKGDTIWKKDSGGGIIELGDVQGDSKKEIASSDRLYATDSTNGELLWVKDNPTKRIGTTVYGSRVLDLKVGDINGDLQNEIVAYGIFDYGWPNLRDPIVLARNPNGDELWRFQTTGQSDYSYTDEESYTNFINIQDLDKDGSVEIVVCMYEVDMNEGTEGKLVVLNGNDGSLLWEEKFESSFYDPNFIDVNGDGYDDILLGSKSGRVYAIDYKTKFVIWKTALRGKVMRIFVKDLNQDGRSEIVASSNPYAYILDLDGNIKGRTLIDWDREGLVVNQLFFDMNTADFDDDGISDITVAYTPNFYVAMMSGFNPNIPLPTFIDTFSIVDQACIKMLI